jgi:hypothetical protein
VDYRKLNDVTKKDCFPLPQIGDNLDTPAGAKWFSNVDLKNGYWQVNIQTDDKNTAFSTGQGLWHFMVMHFSFCKIQAPFERLMETVRRSLTYDTSLMYLDDGIIIDRTFQEHLLNLWKIFERYREARLKLNPGKCHLLQ